MTDMVPLLELSHICRHYHSGEQVVRALDDVSLNVWEGEFVAIMGQSGSGKSTMMNIIGCLDQPSAGNYRISGKEVSGLNADELAALRRDTFGFIFQRYNLIATSSAEENVEMPAIYAGLPRHRRVERARELLDRLGMGERVDHRPSQLSGGQQQRVAVARALMNDPPIILADEPTGALDSRSGEEVMALLKQLHQEGRTIILITHDEKVAQHAERIIRLQDGKIMSTEGEEQPTPLLKRNLGREREATVAEMSEAVKMAMRSLKVNMFRTVLTLLGIVIGVAAVIMMLAIGDGSKEKLLAEITRMGTNLLHVRPGAPGVRALDVTTLTPADAEALTQLPHVVAVVPERSGRYTLRYGNRDHIATVDGTGHLMPDARGWPVEQGYFFTKKDVDGYAPVALIGKTVQQNLFPEGVNPIGRYLLVKNVPFEIIGIMSAKGDTGWGGDQDDKVFVPYTTGIVRLFGRPYLSSISVKVADMSQVEETEKALHALMMERHRVEDFSVRNSASFIEMATNAQDAVTFLLAAVALISLIVGGIGVMNIMLVSVTERTREIGIRMATGARFKDIMIQFNTEATFVCTIGGVMGVVLGFAGGWLLKASEAAAISFSVMPAVAAFLSAVLTGVLFGFLPARKAARMDPVVALASE